MKGLEKIKKSYEEQLKQKDKMIAELKEQNEILMRASLRNSEKMNKLAEELKKALEKIEKSGKN